MKRSGTVRKYCNRCGRKRLLKFFSKDCSKKDGFRTYCKECMNQGNQSYYRNNRSKVLKRTKIYKEANKDWYDEYYANYRKSNKSELSRKNRDYYQDNRARVLVRTGNWAKKNPRKRALIDHRRRARELGQLGFVSENIEEGLWKKQKGKCFYCSASLSKSKYHQEHKTPLSRGGLHDDNNLCLSCPTCNFSKGSKTEKEFRSLGGGYSRTSRN